MQNEGCSRIAFVISNDFGEFGTMRYFTRSQPFESDTHVLLTGTQYEIQKNDALLKIYEYRTPESILSTLDEIEPNVIFFCSAYLFVINKIFTLRQVKYLVRELETREIPLVTTDPLLGYLNQIQPSQIKLNSFKSGLFSAIKRSLFWPQRYRVYRDFKALKMLLVNFVHLYPVPRENLSLENSRINVDFVNEELFSHSAEAIERIADPTRPESSGIWIYVMSRLDMEIQMDLYENNEFVAILCDRLLETVARGKKVKISIPEPLRSLLESRFCNSLEIDVLGYKPYDQFIEELLSAEVAFYWNVLSNSAYLRLLNNLPVLFFDIGHMARIFEGSYEIAIRACLGGRKPRYLDIRAELSEDSLRDKIDESLALANSVKELFIGSLSPVAVLNQIAGGQQNDNPTNERFSANTS
ncbi:MAG: hypothetical protein R3F41_05855 [Gammaproteobacteria bacterium]|nr:hypothetical protein [Pseudomonadales bacterium]